jgi:hypothetical protein
MEHRASAVLLMKGKSSAVTTRNSFINIKESILYAKTTLFLIKIQYIKLTRMRNPKLIIRIRKAANVVVFQLYCNIILIKTGLLKVTNKKHNNHNKPNYQKLLMLNHCKLR